MQLQYRLLINPNLSYHSQYTIVYFLELFIVLVTNITEISEIIELLHIETIATVSTVLNTLTTSSEIIKPFETG